MNAGSELMLDETELAALRESIADVLRLECDSRAVHAWLDRENDLGGAMWRQAAELGWLGLSLPEADGGLGLGARGLQILNRELGAYTVPGGILPTLCGAQWLSTVANADQRAAVLEQVVAGSAGIAIPAQIAAAPLAISQDNATVSGSIDVMGGVLEVTGETFAIVPVAGGWALIKAGGAAERLDAIETWDLTRNLFRLECDNAPVIALIADADGRAASLLRSYIAVAVAADSLGGARAIADKTVAYLKERIQFERPVATYQALRHRCADMMIKLATQDALLEQAVQCLETGSPDADMWALLSKAGSTEVFVFIASDCIQLHGGVGHTWEYDPHIYVKRARLNEALLGDNRSLRDVAVGLLDKAMDEGRTTTELDS